VGGQPGAEASRWQSREVVGASLATVPAEGCGARGDACASPCSAGLCACQEKREGWAEGNVCLALAFGGF